MNESKFQRRLSIGIFFVYFVLLIWLVLFKFQTNLSVLTNHRSINLIPFSETMEVNGRFELSEIIYNILVFVPLGVYLVVLKPAWPFVKKFILCISCSLLFEVLQYVFAIGASDITDLISNSMGGVLGILLGKVFYRLFSKKATIIINTIASIILVLAVILLTILLWNNRS